jgi:hypothetical protein
MKDDFVTKVVKALDHNRWLVASLIASVVIAVMMAGCVSKTASLSNPGAKVDSQAFANEVISAKGELAKRKVELDAAILKFNTDVNSFNDRVAAGQADLQRQDEIRAQLFDTVGAGLTSWVNGSVNPIGILGSVVTLGSLMVTGGVVADNRRKDAVIQTQKKTS